MKSKHVLSVAALAALSTAVPAWSATLVVDLFDAPPGGFSLSDLPGGGSATGSTADPGILGGFRSVELQSDGAAGLLVSADVDINAGIDRLAISNGPGVSSLTVLTYDADGAGLGDLDLLGAGYNSFEFGLDLGDFATGLSVILYDGATTAESHIPLPTAPPSGQFFIPFESFTFGGVGDPFTSLDKIVISLAVPDSGDVVVKEFKFTSAVVIPEGSTLFSALGIAGLMGAYLYRRRPSA